MPSYELLSSIGRNYAELYSDAISDFLDEMTQDEYDTIPTIEVDEATKNTIETYGFIWQTEKGVLYSLGVTPFKFKIKDNVSTAGE